MRAFWKKLEQAAEKADKKRADQAEADERKRKATEEIMRARTGPTQQQPSAEAIARATLRAREAFGMVGKQPDRNLSDEVDYLSGALFAHEFLLIAMIKGLPSGEQRLLIATAQASQPEYEDHPEFGTGYRETLEKLSASL